MDGRRPAGILYVETDVAPPEAREEYHRWYLDVHFAEVCAPGLFVDAAMFRSAREPLAGESHFLALYETPRADLDAVTAAFERHVAGLFAARRIHPGTVGGLFGAYAVRARLGDEGPVRSQSAVALHLDAEPGREAELARWAERQLLPDAAALGLFHSHSFLERGAPRSFANAVEPDAPRFLALFESDRGAPAALAERLMEKLPSGPFGLRCSSAWYRSAA